MNVFNVIFTLFALVVPSFATPLRDCEKPQNLEQQLNNSINDIDPILLSGQTQINAEDLKDEYLSGNKTCPASLDEVVVNKTTGLDVRSTCPYFYVFTHDARRYPVTITEARCKCRSCLEKTGHSVRNVCQPVYKVIDVLYQTECKSGEWKYEQGKYHVQIGCVCAQPNQDINSSDNGSTSTSNDDGPPPM